MEPYAPIPPKMIHPKNWRKPAKQPSLPCWDWVIAARNNICRTSLIDQEFFHEWLDFRRNLSSAGPCPNDCNPLSSKIIVVSPLGSVPLHPFEVFHPWDSPTLRLIKLSASIDNNIRPPINLLFCGRIFYQHFPVVILPIPTCLDDFRIE